ncbi:MAG: 5-(carboxyamino)imidazole ribonucleotide mutase [Calditrichales bacterium]|nr:MAG: 5-(carboxyamino)imidazole ribonucleotide mutase [Calditrichales bacterium]
MSHVAILLGSKSDIKYWEDSKKYLDYFGISADLKILSAHRTPDEVAEFSKKARSSGYKVIIAAAGMAAHLAGAVAAHSDLPVLGVPLPGGILDGMDALLSTVQMPAGVPVATFAVGTAGFRNACVFTAQILSLNDTTLRDKLAEFTAQGARL